MNETNQTFANASGAAAGTVGAREPSARLKNIGTDILDSIESKAKEAAESAFRSAADKIRVYNTALESAADSLDENKEREAAESVRSLSAMIDDTANTVENSTASDAIEYVRRGALAYPSLVLAGAAIVGFAISRILAAAPADEAGDSPTR